MAGENQFYTVRGYALQHRKRNSLTDSMEDYVEMLYRLSLKQKEIRLNDLATALNVKPPSATRMVQKLAKEGFLEYRRYGHLCLTQHGREVGAYLLERHNTISEFLRLIGVREGRQQDTERMEHYLSDEAITCLRRFLACLKEEKGFLPGQPALGGNALPGAREPLHPERPKRRDLPGSDPR